LHVELGELTHFAPRKYGRQHEYGHSVRTGKPQQYQSISCFFVLSAVSCFGDTGNFLTEFAALDEIMRPALTTYSVKGGSLAVVKNGRLVYARGFGMGDVEAGIAVQPTSLFRWASVSNGRWGDSRPAERHRPTPAASMSGAGIATK